MHCTNQFRDVRGSRWSVNQNMKLKALSEASHEKQLYNWRIFVKSSISQQVKYETRWYPWGIQRLVSTYSNLYMGWGGVMWNVKCQNPKCQDLSKFLFSGGGGQRGGRWCETKFHFRGEVRNLVKNFWKPSLPLHHR